VTLESQLFTTLTQQVFAARKEMSFRMGTIQCTTTGVVTQADTDRTDPPSIL
jgi:hypothetical protein